MRKRVGITTDIQRRQQFWQGMYPHITVVFNIEARGLTYEQAQKMEDEYIARGYTGSPGGNRIDGPYYFVYTFSY